MKDLYINGMTTIEDVIEMIKDNIDRGDLADANDYLDQLMDLFHKIKLDLSDSSFPTRTNRLEAVENMKKGLQIHDYVILEKGEQ